MGKEAKNPKEHSTLRVRRTVTPAVLRKVEKRGALEIAKRLRQTVGQVFRYGVVTGRAKRDPSVDLKARCLWTASASQGYAARGFAGIPAGVVRL